MLKEFREFILKGNAFDLAVGVIIGAAFGAVVTSLVTDILMPPLGYVMGGINFADYFIDLTALKAQVMEGEAAAQAKQIASLDEARKAGHAVIAYGNFINQVINLLIVGAAIFLIVKQINRLRRAPETPAAPAAPPEDVKLLTEIRDLLRGASPETPKPAAPKGGRPKS